MNEDKQWNLYKIIMTTLLIGFCAFFIFFGIVINLMDREYDKMYNSPPSINYIEEDLEEVFMTRDVTVYKVDDSKDVIYYSVTANGFNYKVEYKLRRSKFIYWEWRYIRHIEIAINDNERTN
nr:MAG TPA: Potassium voltage-gated channel subfamily E helix, detergent micelle, Membrane [Bacteriophage sp.]